MLDLLAAAAPPTGEANSLLAWLCPIIPWLIFIALIFLGFPRLFKKQNERIDRSLALAERQTQLLESIDRKLDRLLPAAATPVNDAAKDEAVDAEVVD